MKSSNSVQLEGLALEQLSDSQAQHQYIAYCHVFFRRQGALNVIKQLHQIVKLVQKHRGMSMAILAGSPLFDVEFKGLQAQLARRLYLLEGFSQQGDNLLSQRDQENLRSAWLTINGDWQGDDTLDNFEFHSHFIEQLHGLIMGLAKGLVGPLASYIGSDNKCSNGPVSACETDVDHTNMLRDIEFLNFLARELPSMVEFVARIRGLATYAAAKGRCDNNHSRKLKFAITCVREGSQKNYIQAQRLATIVKPMAQSLVSVREYEPKLQFFLELIESEYLLNTDITESSHQLFKIATDIIDTYLDVLEDGWHLVSRWQENYLESWLLSPMGDKPER